MNKSFHAYQTMGCNFSIQMTFRKGFRCYRCDSYYLGQNISCNIRTCFQCSSEDSSYIVITISQSVDGQCNNHNLTYFFLIPCLLWISCFLHNKSSTFYEGCILIATTLVARLQVFGCLISLCIHNTALTLCIGTQRVDARSPSMMLYRTNQLLSCWQRSHNVILSRTLPF